MYSILRITPSSCCYSASYDGNAELHETSKSSKQTGNPEYQGRVENWFKQSSRKLKHHYYCTLVYVKACKVVVACRAKLSVHKYSNMYRKQLWVDSDYPKDSQESIDKLVSDDDFNQQLSKTLESQVLTSFLAGIYIDSKNWSGKEVSSKFLQELVRIPIGILKSASTRGVIHFWQTF